MKFLDSLFLGQSVVLTSHSLVECDVLCDNIAIMVEGDILCTESPAELRQKYGSGYKINLKMGPESTEQKVNDFINQNFNNNKFIEHKYNWIKYRVEGKISSILTLLDIAKTQQIIDSFTIDVASLEDIFLQITQKEGNEVIRESKLDIADTVDDGINVDDVKIDSEDVPDAAQYDPPPENVQTK